MTMGERALFERVDFTLHGGGEAHWKIECDALTDEEIDTLALMLSEVLPPFASVYGVPRGGERLAAALAPYRVPPVAAHLIVDDVLTTGRSMEEARQRRYGIGAVLFARGKSPAWITPLFQMPDGGDDTDG